MKEQGEKLKLRKVGKSKKSEWIKRIFMCHEEWANYSSWINPVHLLF